MAMVVLSHVVHDVSASVDHDVAEMATLHSVVCVITL